MSPQAWNFIRDWIFAHLPARWRRVPVLPKPILEWDIAAETGEFTHILKDGPHTISITPARGP